MPKWLPVPGFEGKYEVSDDGRVRNRRGHEMKPYLNRRLGYMAVQLYNDGRKQNRLIHKLVVRAFLGPRPEGLVIRHLDGNHENNALSNLIYGTDRENVADSIVHGTHVSVRWAARTHCGAGHEYTPENTYRPPRRPNKRDCRACKNQRQARARAHG